MQETAKSVQKKKNVLKKQKKKLREKNIVKKN